MTDLRLGGVLLMLQQIVMAALILRVFICFQRLNFETESIGKRRKDRCDKDWYNWGGGILTLKTSTCTKANLFLPSSVTNSILFLASITLFTS